MTTSPVRYRRRGQDGHTVLAWQVTPDNRDQVARWCHGRVEYRLTEPRDVRVRPDRCTTAAHDWDYIVQVGPGAWHPMKRLLFELNYERRDMTWSAKFTVQDVGDGPAPIDILAAANADDGDNAIISNTEGKIRAMELRIHLDEDSTNIKIGDVITASGHFLGTP